MQLTSAEKQKVSEAKEHMKLVREYRAKSRYYCEESKKYN